MPPFLGFNKSCTSIAECILTWMDEYLRSTWVSGEELRRWLQFYRKWRVGAVCTKEVCSHMWLSPNMPTTSCWITPASFNTGVFSFCRLYYANLFEVMHAYTIIYICLYVITWTLMLGLERNDSTSRCAGDRGGGRGECSCDGVQQEQRPIQNRSCL